MKRLVLFTFFISILGCSTSHKEQTLQTPQTLPTPQNQANKGTASAREQIIKNAQPQLEKGGISISVEGYNKDIIRISSKSLSNYQIVTLLKNSFQDFRKAGFSEINISDKSNELQNINLKMLD